MKVTFERRLEKFIEFVEAEVCAQFWEFGLSHELSHVGAAMMLTWFGLADLVDGIDEDGPVWIASGPLALPPTPRNKNPATRERRRRPAEPTF